MEEKIISNILSRLPVKSLLICKSVCKYWRSLISSPSFMHLHLIQSQENPTYVFYPHVYWGNSIHLLTKTDGDTTERIPGCDGFYFKGMMTKTDGNTTERIPGCDGFYFKGMITSFNGLICCTDFGEGRISGEWTENSIMDIRICNPATREVLLLPPTATGSKYLPKVGVSFGPTINKYKVFQFFCREEELYECKVYSSITGSWKSIGSVVHNPFNSGNHVCINGIVYWFTRSRIDGRLVDRILAVDMEENFIIIRIPKEIDLCLWPCPFLVNLEGSLCLVARPEDGSFDIWALQDSKESVWVKIWSDDIPPTFNQLGISYVAVRKNEILFADLGNYNCFETLGYVFYNMGTRTWRNFNWHRRQEDDDLFSRPMAYTESLLPCNGHIDS